MVDLTRIVPSEASPKGDADLPEPGQVRLDRAKRGIVEQTGAGWNRLVSWLSLVDGLRAVQLASGPV